MMTAFFTYIEKYRRNAIKLGEAEQARHKSLKDALAADPKNKSLRQLIKESERMLCSNRAYVSACETLLGGNINDF